MLGGAAQPGGEHGAYFVGFDNEHVAPLSGQDFAHGDKGFAQPRSPRSRSERSKRPLPAWSTGRGRGRKAVPAGSV